MKCNIWGWDTRYPDYRVKKFDKDNDQESLLEISEELYNRYLTISEEYDKVQDELKEIIEKVS